MAARGPISLTDLSSNSLLDRAFEWLCHRRRAYPPDADIWSFRQKWPEEKDRLEAGLLAGRFRFGLQRRITRQDGSEVDLWSPRNALLLKCLAWLLGEKLRLSKRCAHLKGHGGAKVAVRVVREQVGENRFVRYMDDVIVLAPTRWKLRRAVRVVNEVLTNLRLEKAMEKTFIGHVERGFDFLGFRLLPDSAILSLGVAQATWERFCERATRLYEQAAEEPSGSSRLETYVRRWRGWVTAGGLPVRVPAVFVVAGRGSVGVCVIGISG